MRHSRAKVATFISRKIVSTDDEDEQNCRYSDTSSLTNSTLNKTSSEFNLSSTTSTRSSGVDILTSSLSMVAISSKQSLNNADGKSKTGVRNFFRKIFQSSKSTPIDSRSIQRSPYPPVSSLPITQGPIRLFVLRHGERLDRYYSSQWLRQAFDNDGNFCRFSPILP